MRVILLTLLTVPLAIGCNNERFQLKTRVAGNVETRLDTPPVSPSAGHVKPVLVQGGAPRIALVDVDGLILNTPFVGPLSVGENPVALFREKLEAVACDPCAKAVVLRINSPGGGVAACIAMRHDLEQFKARTRLPVVACLMDTATGGAYYLASAADHIVAGPATVTGGLGVVLNLFNLQDLMGMVNVRPQLIKSGERTDIGTSARRLTDGERELLQAMADEFRDRLAADIRRSRPGVVERLETPFEGSMFGWNLDRGRTFDGRILTAEQAKARNLVDAVGSLDDAISVAAQMGCPGGPARPGVVMYRRTNDPARSVYAVTANIPLQGAGLFPSVPGIDRAKLPTFLSVWQPELTMERLGGK
ncbi:Putative signal peptide peptidase SppA [Gemmata obscuriglobus]|uniref:S49 family peptidase n=1 Tax=Gemmata obscuriglobus TaxID=114 RepID=A0A2Z3GSY2_9BACT|nr:S49 family peptidase [Gemmata obscuriglobus]AWM36378.1 S49 family peptidase [Gemmata obscuriglobus]QEG31010.1 Putative signal peptide peptidase SppA [Gemmata obscuriglobus]VTS10345.1 signal peptide peptidase 36k type : Signal peptide peptidase SppA, 36K type OS=Isosphaera pallida (strain ATCC 43644 / DSM 9630 / IS1B) GN=Isop_2117 PE=4 SV=1: Peptidase_S49 [Gemmata obscuriglobus UQM 2246]